MRALSIDFGTSNTVAIVGNNGSAPRPLLFDGSPMLPSAVYLETTGAMLVGRDAERNARVDPTRFEPNPKRRIDDGVVFLGDQELAATALISQVLTRVATEARRQLGGNPAQVRMTHPARWGEHRRQALLQAAKAAGLPQPQLIAEPVAAASYFTAMLGTQVAQGHAMGIYDLGGGTFDATVVRRTPQGFEVLAEGGLPDVGGLDFDHAIIEHLGKIYSASHSDQWERLMSPTDGADRRYRRMLWEDARGTKEMLSRASQADIHLPALEVDAHLTRDELENLIKPMLERTVLCLQSTIEAARLAPRELVGIFLVGGSSRIPLAAATIHSQLGVAPTTLEQPETVVAEGALRMGGGVPRTQANPAPVSGPGQASAPPMQQRPPVSPPPMQAPRPPVHNPRPTPAPPRQAPPATPRPPVQQRPIAPRPVPRPPARQSQPQNKTEPAVIFGAIVAAVLFVVLIVVVVFAAK
ncbi:MAG: Hsp70 family protein [Corynebacteriales bacterium]|nr:Hsp70 family protein [Mycobacteriales bacterium]